MKIKKETLEKINQQIKDLAKQMVSNETLKNQIAEIDKNEITIIATGPLTSDKLFSEISKLVENRELHFFDAAAPIV